MKKMKIGHKIREIMLSTGKPGISPLTFLLWFVSVIYGIVARLRNAFYLRGILKRRQLPCKVISIGNLTVGGTGKTPLTIYVARFLNQLGYAVCVVSRGYKGSEENKGGIVSDGNTLRMSVKEAGDEPLMMARALKTLPVLVGGNRYETGMRAVRKFNPDVILLDDGFQHIKLKRDIDLVLMDSTHPLGNSYLLPRGILREPVSALLRADAIIMTRCDPKTEPLPDISRISKALPKIMHDRPVFRTFHKPFICKIDDGNFGFKGLSETTVPEDFGFFAGKRVLAFSGIAHNEYFRQTLASFKCDIADFYPFQDHHPYARSDLKRISKAADQLQADLLVTTEKDYVRLPEFDWPVPLAIIGVEISFLDELSFTSYLTNKIKECERSKE